MERGCGNDENMKKALLVIDMQNFCVGVNHSDYFNYDCENLINSVNQVIAYNEGNLVVYIQNILRQDEDNPFAPFEAYEGTKEVELADGLLLVSEYVFKKYSGDAFTNPALDVFLKERDIECVEVIGVDGGGCVPLTALGAIRAGYKVFINEAAIGTKFEKNKNKQFKRLRKMGATIWNSLS